MLLGLGLCFRAHSEVDGDVPAQRRGRVAAGTAPRAGRAAALLPQGLREIPGRYSSHILL